VPSVPIHFEKAPLFDLWSIMWSQLGSLSCNLQRSRQTRNLIWSGFPIVQTDLKRTVGNKKFVVALIQQVLGYEIPRWSTALRIRLSDRVLVSRRVGLTCAITARRSSEAICAVLDTIQYKSREAYVPIEAYIQRAFSCARQALPKVYAEYRHARCCRMRQRACRRSVIEPK
jgi:hypothetical protein